ncbi:MAG: uracil-DNA glycosylase [Bacteroides sp.]|nr:uracil-DNA glycosylase [Ruminococcus flavefaciens]MCM1554450.1 uracil-DNA glycosylase [Bacteroides sp.]
MAYVNPQIEPGWLEVLRPQFEAPYFAELKRFLVQEKQTQTVYPPGKLIFNAFNSTPFDQVKVVLIGQDPYHEPGQAEGLCFSVPDGCPFPPSLVNILKEIQQDLGIDFPRSGHLGKWARQGVFLLNATLTVRAHQAGSHQKHGWETFTDAVISSLSQHKSGLVFLLWGSFAQAKASLIDTSKHFILKSVHPSPLSAYRGFFGCRHFSQTNALLQQQGLAPIDWDLNKD